MRRILVALLVAIVLIMALAAPALAVKPADNLAGNVKVGWNLSADVMPVPPYGSLDIPGSDEASKLNVNQPNGNTEVAITGVMNGLNPSTTYTVYLSKGYTPYTPLNVIGTYKWLVLNTYEHDLIIDTQNPDGTFSGTGGYPAGGSPYNASGQTAEVITGLVVGNQISLTTTYLGPYNTGYTATAEGTIAADGTMSGTIPWEWHSTDGAVALASGSTGWPGLFAPTIQPFTFVTDEFGAGSWHVNMRDSDFSDPGTYTLSVWINAGGTLLISDNFEVVVD